MGRQVATVSLFNEKFENGQAHIEDMLAGGAAFLKSCVMFQRLGISSSRSDAPSALLSEIGKSTVGYYAPECSPWSCYLNVFSAPS